MFNCSPNYVINKEKIMFVEIDISMWTIMIWLVRDFIVKGILQLIN